MHEIDLKIRMFLDGVMDGTRSLDDAIAEEYGKLSAEVVKRQFSPRQGGFTLRLSAIGRPLCQQLHEQAGTPALPEPSDFRIKMLIGDMSELIVLALLRASGVKVVSYQERVSLKMPKDAQTLDGTLDVVLETDGEEAVWDVKSCSKYAFQNKFTSYEALSANDDFGYVPQLFGYAMARKVAPGGWIALCKETGEIAVVPVPKDKRGDWSAIYSNIVANVNQLRHPCGTIPRLPDEPEFFRKKPTGNRQLSATCGFCSFKLACWPEAEFKPSVASTAANPPWKWYTHISEEK